MLGTLERLVVRELRISVGETAEKGAALTGQLRQDVRASVEPTKAQQFAIATTGACQGSCRVNHAANG